MNSTLKPLGADIFLVENLFDAALCQHIREIAECCSFKTAGIELGTVDDRIRSNDLLYLGEGNDLMRSTDRLVLGRVAIIQRLLYEHYGIKFPHSESCSILRYRSGQYYKRHVDNLLLESRLQEAAQGVPTRDVSVVGYLNDDFEGGETFFDRQDIKVKPKQGAVLVFPAYYTYPHQSLPVTQGTKYAFSTWLFH